MQKLLANKSALLQENFCEGKKEAANRGARDLPLLTSLPTGYESFQDPRSPSSTSHRGKGARREGQVDLRPRGIEEEISALLQPLYSLLKEQRRRFLLIGEGRKQTVINSSI
ncbi:hypothetical protein C4D60_Mb04t15620 [Musa balbisiana]|uniref:Uncharacterized protein n=1 Tax=Musa balbisiana TaxID=52838 RepID=A0A4S8KCA7_MUSBA|nr:hypothetical protein C4D60_Mb04t15620 [Musa balbisiana]